LPEDLAFFKRKTIGHPIVMGRKTFESIGNPLPGRKNIIVTNNKQYKADGCKVIHNIHELLALEGKYNTEVFVIGGSSIFKEAIGETTTLYLTKIEGEFEGDTYFPDIIKENEWKMVSKEKGIKDEKNPYDYYFIKYVRVSAEN
jgi:dihydrofolate reductase